MYEGEEPGSGEEGELTFDCDICQAFLDGITSKNTDCLQNLLQKFLGLQLL